NLQLDFALLERVHQYVFGSVFIPRHHCDRYFCRQHYDGKLIRFFFGSRKLEIMRSSDAQLNNDCINGIAQLFQYIFSLSTDARSAASHRCAVFSTHDLLMVRYNASDKELWRRTHGSQFWLKDVWIIPIHCRYPAEHWVLAYVRPHLRQTFYFDSFAEMAPWKRETK